MDRPPCPYAEELKQIVKVCYSASAQKNSNPCTAGQVVQMLRTRNTYSRQNQLPSSYSQTTPQFEHSRMAARICPSALRPARHPRHQEHAPVHWRGHQEVRCKESSFGAHPVASSRTRLAVGHRLAGHCPRLLGAPLVPSFWRLGLSAAVLLNKNTLQRLS
jgi:hypothetical protein